MLVLDVSRKTRFMDPTITVFTLHFVTVCKGLDHNIRHISGIAKLRVVFAHVLVNSSEF